MDSMSLEKTAKFLFGVGLSVFLGWLIVNLYYDSQNQTTSCGSAFDDSDDLVNCKRSGLKVYTDHKTGVQYVGPANGGITMRVDAFGKPIVKGN